MDPTNDSPRHIHNARKPLPCTEDAVGLHLDSRNRTNLIRNPATDYYCEGFQATDPLPNVKPIKYIGNSAGLRVEYEVLRGSQREGAIRPPRTAG